MLLPSAIQRVEDFVGMEMPIVPLSSAESVCHESALRPIANAVRTSLYVFIFLKCSFDI